MYEQAKKLHMSSRSVLNSRMPETHKFVCEYLGYEQFSAASSGVEACEGAIKLARKWGHVVKGIPDNCAEVILPTGVFWGRSITASGNSSCPIRGRGMGPHTPGFPLVAYNDLDALEHEL